MGYIKGAGKAGAVFAFLAKNKLLALCFGLPAQPVDKAQLHKMDGMVSRKQTFDIRAVVQQPYIKQPPPKIVNQARAGKFTGIKKPVSAFVFVINYRIGFYKKRYGAKFVHGIYAHYKMI